MLQRYNIEMYVREKKPPVNKTEASYQHLLLEMMGEMVKQQKETNRILRKLANEETILQNKIDTLELIKKAQGRQIESRQPEQEPIKGFYKKSMEIQKPSTTHNKYMDILIKKLDDKIQQDSNYQTQLINFIDDFKIILIPNMLNSKNKQSQTMVDNNLNKQFRKLVRVDSTNRQLQTYKQKYYHRLQKIQTYSDRREIKVRINFIDLLKISNIEAVVSIQQIANVISQWVGIVYRATASICWNILQNKQLSFDQAKILFTQNIIFNYIEFMKDLRSCKDYHLIGNNQLEYQATTKINNDSVSVLDFLCKQYPQTKIDDPNMKLRSITPQFDQKGKVQYDLIAKSKIKFKFKQNKSYATQIMEFINYLISVSDCYYDRFEQYMWGIFQKLFLPIDKRNQQKVEQNKQINEYRQKVKKYTKYLIGRKIPKNTTKYTQQELQNGIFFIKSPKIMRVISKWVQQLTAIIYQPQKYVRDWYYPFKRTNGGQVHFQYVVRNGIYNAILRERGKLLNTLKQIQQKCYEIEGQLTKQKLMSSQKIMHLSQQQINIGLFASNLNHALSQYLFLQLNQLIHFLLQIPLKVDETKLQLNSYYFKNKARGELNQLNLLTFNVFDLIRCKCISGQNQIVYLMNLFKQKDQNRKIKLNQPFQFAFVRTKDRLSQGSRDILINAQIFDGPVCQIQLSIISQVQQKQQLLDKYNHFLYQIKRATILGPLIENVSIWTTLQQKATYFHKMSKKKFKSAINIPEKHICPKPRMKKYFGPIVCYKCQTFYDISRTCLLVWKCQTCNKTLCGQCRYLGFSQFQRKKIIFGNLLSQQLLQNLTQYIKVKDYKDMPKYAFFIPKVSLKEQLCFLQTYESTNQNNFEIAQTVINTKLKKIMSKSFSITSLQKQDRTLKNFLIFGISQKYIQKTNIRKLIQNLQNGKLKKLINILYEPTYISQIKDIKSKKVIAKLLTDIEEKMNEKNIQSIIVVKSKQTTILVQLDIDAEQLRKKLIRKVNIEAIRKISKSNSSIMCLQHKNITNQLDYDRIQGRLTWETYYNLCDNVTKLYLNFGNISNIQSLIHMKRVQILSISNNQIKSLKGVQGMLKLKNITFDCNLIQSLDPLKNLLMLQLITGNDNKLKQLRGISQLNKLKQLALYQNQLDTLGDYLNQLENLQVLYLRKNRIQNYDKVGTLKKLYKLNLSDNFIKTIKDFTMMPLLTHLSLSFLNLNQIPIKQICMLELIDLSIHDNQIASLQGLNNLKQLKFLSVKNNKILSMVGLQGLKLQRVYLDNNQIKVIQGLLSSLQTLTQFKIRKNPIQDIGDLRYSNFDFQFGWSRETYKQSAIIQLQQHLAQNIKNKILSVSQLD